MEVERSLYDDIKMYLNAIAEANKVITDLKQRVVWLEGLCAEQQTKIREYERRDSALD